MPGLDAPDPDVPGRCIPHSRDPGLDAVPGRHAPQLAFVQANALPPAVVSAPAHPHRVAVVPGLDRAVPGLDDAADRSAAPRELDLARELAVCGLDEAYESEEFDDVPGRAPIG